MKASKSTTIMENMVKIVRETVTDQRRRQHFTTMHTSQWLSSVLWKIQENHTPPKQKVWAHRTLLKSCLA